MDGTDYVHSNLHVNNCYHGLLMLSVAVAECVQVTARFCRSAQRRRQAERVQYSWSAADWWI